MQQIVPLLVQFTFCFKFLFYSDWIICLGPVEKTEYFRQMPIHWDHFCLDQGLLQFQSTELELPSSGTSPMYSYLSVLMKCNGQFVLLIFEWSLLGGLRTQAVKHNCTLTCFPTNGICEHTWSFLISLKDPAGCMFLCFWFWWATYAATNEHIWRHKLYNLNI